MESTSSGVGGPPQWIALYDSGTKEILHIHERIGADASDTVSDAELGEEAMALGYFGEEERLSVAYPAPDVQLDPSMDYEVVEGRLQPRPATQGRFSEVAERRRS
jgi:hypothetical protein